MKKDILAFNSKPQNKITFIDGSLKTVEQLWMIALLAGELKEEYYESLKTVVHTIDLSHINLGIPNTKLPGNNPTERRLIKIQKCIYDSGKGSSDYNLYLETI